MVMSGEEEKEVGKEFLGPKAHIKPIPTSKNEIANNAILAEESPLPHQITQAKRIKSKKWKTSRKTPLEEPKCCLTTIWSLRVHLIREIG